MLCFLFTLGLRGVKIECYTSFKWGFFIIITFEIIKSIVMFEIYLKSGLMSVYDDAFDALLFGSGSYLGLLIIIAITVILLVVWKYSGVLTFPISLTLGIYYLMNNLGTQALIIWVNAIFILVFMVKGVKK